MHPLRSRPHHCVSQSARRAEADVRDCEHTLPTFRARARSPALASAFLNCLFFSANRAKHARTRDWRLRGAYLLFFDFRAASACALSSSAARFQLRGASASFSAAGLERVRQGSFSDSVSSHPAFLPRTMQRISMDVTAA
ncbi:hypothetical protein DENSPDRAFT_283466 [Dentipellis sp. KUC8613]|nr:hypothetical protein DENSPDRAFT_283466 [Dentipellis sp. KUC8613]